jgi:hypothetical protein
MRSGQQERSESNDAGGDLLWLASLRPGLEIQAALRAQSGLEEAGYRAKSEVE